MNLRCLAGALVLAVSGWTASSAEEAPGDKGERVKQRLLQLFELCKAGKTAEAAGYFVYRGPDRAREWKTVADASKEDEKALVEQGCGRIKGMLDESSGYDIGPLQVEKESEGEWHVLELRFKQAGESSSAAFAFLEIDGQFALGDID